MCREVKQLARCHTAPTCGFRQPWGVVSPTLTLTPGPHSEKGEEKDPWLGFLLQDRRGNSDVSNC